MVLASDTPLFTALSALGFTQYEARAYSALLATGPGNGHEIAKASGVPPSKIYETLARLLERGAVLKAPEEPARYLARPWAEVSAALLAHFGAAAETVEGALKTLEGPRKPGMIWSLPDRAAVLGSAQAFLGQARHSVFASLWDRELPDLRPALEATAARGVTLHVALYGQSALAAGHSYDMTACGRSAVERMSGRRLMTLVADGVQALVAEIHPDDTVEAIRTDTPVIGLLVSEYVKADVLGRLLIDDMGEARFEALRRDPGLIDALLRG